MSMNHAASFCSCLESVSQHFPSVWVTVKGMIELKVSSVHREEWVSLGYGHETWILISHQTFGPLARLLARPLLIQLSEMRIFHEILIQHWKYSSHQYENLLKNKCFDRSHVVRVDFDHQSLYLFIQKLGIRITSLVFRWLGIFWSTN